VAKKKAAGTKAAKQKAAAKKSAAKKAAPKKAARKKKSAGKATRKKAASPEVPAQDEPRAAQAAVDPGSPDDVVVAAEVSAEDQAALAESVEAETQEIGRGLVTHGPRRKASIFERRWWDDRLLSWAMADESVKVQMFRFVDVLPMLGHHEQVARHLQEYFEEVDEHLPSAARLFVEHAGPNTVLGRALAVNARSNARRMADRFIAGHSSDEVLQSVTKLRKQGFAFSLDLLGEAVVSEPEAIRYKNSYMDLLSELDASVNGWSEEPLIDHDHRGPIPRLNVSLKLSALYSQFKPIDPAGTAEAVKKRLRPIFRRAQRTQAYVHVDMEQYAYKDLTLHIFKEILMEEEFRQWPDCGIVIQAYLPDAERDLLKLREWVTERGTPITVRLVKGAYWDYETVLAEQHGWPVPVFQEKWRSDENFERLSRFLMENYETLRPAFGSHNLRSLAHAIAWGRKLNVPQRAYEIQMLYGMAQDHARLFHELGHRVRIYTPFGDALPGMAYLVRRLLENTSNDSFLRHAIAEDIPWEKLMAKPSASAVADDASASNSEAGSDVEPTTLPFQNEPLSDFSRDDVREAFQEALEQVDSELGNEYALIIDGRRVETRGQLVSRNPSNKSQIVGTVASASPADAQEAIDAARRAFSEWSQHDTQYRAEFLTLTARSLRERRFELAAWIVYECGKPWAEADADVAEAIDFCEYYAKAADLLLAPREVDIAGEENTYFYRPRGVAAVIAPWNFPLAILTGMTVAALVTGNTVVLKPAEQSAVVAAKLMEIFLSIGLPDGVVNYLPGVGEEVGPALVNSPDIDLIAFTGSRDVGLEINRSAAETDPRQTGVRKVIAEMGGKNAIIVDDDADLDEAVLGTVQSAFAYSGQKCSACSRVIVLRDVYPAFVKRLVAATRSLNVGPAEQPGVTVGPVIDEAAVERINRHIEIGKAENRLVCEYPLDEDVAAQGYFVAPHIFADVDPSSRLAQEEIFGPVIAAIPVNDMDEAIEVANGTDFALTAGVFSRSPVNLRRCATELAAGNLYLNRGITGAFVNRQPFGGFRMSGIGSKAGGPDYLLQFVVPVNVTENTLRRGFAPQKETSE
jgi:RHH-type proline utilization regulon transcriptional repressor/proline dehydrogenase/delta 1-pyrroline-5-carboxylate dehydrogenase